MMKKIFFFAGIFLLFILISGCSGPKYQPCCKLENATDPDNPICDGGLDPETEAPLIWPLAPSGCDTEEAWVCNVTQTDGMVTKEVSLPICPRLEDVQCNTTCSGVFCGSFFYDPRPIFPAVGPNSAYPGASDDEGEDDEEGTIPPEPTGLWNAQCAVMNITPNFIRHIENSDSITMNTFRFGVGNSFQDFEDAQYYFPLSDHGCSFNPRGTKERYMLYAIPNMDAHGDKLCSGYGGGQEETGCYHYSYVCNLDKTIYAENYLDCARRCVLAHTGWDTTFDPYFSYPTANKRSEIVGNPYAYGLDYNIYGTYDNMYAGVIKGEDSLATYRSRVGPLVVGASMVAGDLILVGEDSDDIEELSVVTAAKIDDYQKGTNLYGAAFGGNGMSFDISNGELPLLPYVSKVGGLYSSAGEDREVLPEVRLFNQSTFDDVYSDNPYTNNDPERFLPFYYSWDSGDEQKARTVFLTAEDDAHNIYPWLLTHHSIYGKQIAGGGQADFECASSEECLSAYCSTSEYQRSACISYDSGGVNCDCYETSQGVVCRGTRAIDVPSWDNPEEDIRVGITMSAPISYYADAESSTAEADSVTSVPSLGAVTVLGNTPYFIMPLGGSGAPEGRSVEPYIDPEYLAPDALEGGPIVMPTYNSLTKDYMREAGGWESDYCGFMQYVINPTSAGMMYADAAEEGQESAPLPPSCGGGLWAMGDSCMVHMSLCMGGECGSATVNTIYYSSSTSGLSYPVVYGYTHWLFDDSVLGYTCHPSVPWESCDEGLSCLNCAPQEHGEYCKAQDFQYQKDRFLPKILRDCGVERGAINLCFSQSASDKFGLPVGFNHFESTGWWLAQNPNINIVGAGDVCEYIRSLNDPDDETKLAQYKRAVCYQWASGGRKPASDQDICVAEALAFLVVLPEIVPEDGEDYEGRYALGSCVYNSKGDDLEVNTYGICESCGYLTMAKEHIVALPEDSGEPGYDTEDGFSGGSSMYGNNYCPDMVVHTPFSISALRNGNIDPGNELYDWRFYMLAPGEQEGSVRIEYGSNVYANNEDMDMCIYPNGYKVFDDYEAEELNDKNPQRGLPSTLPNAFYINRKLESLMKRNIQPVIFADDAGLWTEDIVLGGEDEDNNLLVLKVDDDEVPDWTTAQLLKDLYLQRPDLFIEYQDLIKEDSYFTLDGSFLANTMLNEGGAILVMKVAGSQSDDFDSGSSTTCSGDYDGFCVRKIHEDISRRSLSTRVLCPNCMTSVAFGYEGDDTSKFNNSARFEQIARVFSYSGSSGQVITDPTANASCWEEFGTGMTCNNEVLGDIDVISVKLVLQDKDPYCDPVGRGPSKFDSVLNGITEIGSTSLKRYSKPVVITDLIIKRGECWSEKEAGEFMAYLGTKVTTLSKSGVIGIIYGDWESTEDEKTGVRYELKDGVYSYRGEFYNGVSIAARNFAGFKFQTFFNEVPVAENCTCEPCDSTDDPAICNGHFKGILSAPVCDDYDPFSDIPTKWQDGCIIDDVCMSEENLNVSTIICDIRYNNGTRGTATFLGSDVVAYPSVYKDVISAINRPGAVGGSYTLIPLGTLEASAVGVKTGVFTGFTLGEVSEDSSSTELGDTPLGGGSAADILGAGVQIGEVAHGRGFVLGDVGLVPCFSAGGLNISYTTMGSQSFGATPAAFSMQGDPDVACDPVEGAGEICGYVPPIIDYVMDCTIVNPNYPAAVKEECLENEDGPCITNEDCPCEDYGCQQCYDGVCDYIPIE